MTTTAQADRELIEAIINDYHTTRLTSDPVPHILSKPRTQKALAAYREEGAKAMQEVLDALSKAGPIHAGPVGGDLGRKYPDARQCVVEFAPGQGGGAYDLHSALVSLRAALDPAQIAGGQP